MEKFIREGVRHEFERFLTDDCCLPLFSSYRREPTSQFWLAPIGMLAVTSADQTPIRAGLSRNTLARLLTVMIADVVIRRR